MRPLVYMVSFGSPLYAEMARVCIDSLRAKGGYQGDIAVVTEGSFAPRPEQRVRTIQVAAPASRFDMLAAKGRFAPLLDVSAYDAVLCIDTDVVAVSDIAPLFEGLEGLVRGGDESPFHTLAAASAGGALTAEERERFKTVPGINAGILAFDARIFAATMARWSEAVEEFRPFANRYVDQPPLNALIARKQIPFAPWPRGWIELPPLYPPYGMETRISPEAKLVHFCAADKQEVLQDMLGIDALLASLARGETDSQRLAGRDLFFLHQQIKNWKDEAARQAGLAAERQGWVEKLEEAKRFLTAQREEWEREAAFQKQQAQNWKAELERLLEEGAGQRLIDAERKQWIEKLEEARTFLAAQAKQWETEATYQREQSAKWEAEAAYHRQQALNWQHEAAQLRTLLDQQAAQGEARAAEARGAVREGAAPAAGQR